MEDIAPGLLEKIQKTFRENYENDEEIKELLEKLREHIAKHPEAYTYAGKAGSILADAYSKNLSSSVLPEGKMWYNIGDRVISPTLSELYDHISDYAAQVQVQLNSAAGIGIKPIIPPENKDRAKGIIDRLSGEDDFDKASWILQEPINTIARSIVDDSIQANAEFHGKSGMQPKIIRKSSGKCCEWCNKVAGIYNYPDVPKDVYRRHQNCDCTVEYDPGNGRKRNVHTKKVGQIEKQVRIKKSSTTEQNYLPVKGEKTIDITDTKMGNIHLVQIDGYDEVYVQSGIKIKPKALHSINKNILSAINAYGGEMRAKPKIVVVDVEKLGKALGKYDCVQNIIYVAPDIGDKKQLSKYISLDTTIKMGSTEYHECWHWMQAQGYRKEITYENRDTEYFPWLIKKCKKNIESLGITEYNTFEVSDYAEDAFLKGRFDEVEAEYYVKRFLTGKD